MPRARHWQQDPNFRTNPSGSRHGRFVPIAVMATNFYSKVMLPNASKSSACLASLKAEQASLYRLALKSQTFPYRGEPRLSRQ